MEDGDGEQPDQLLQSKGNTESKHDSKLDMEDALLDKGSEPLFESDSDIVVDKRTDSEINADLSEAEISDGLLCDGVINMLRKILDTKETREIVRQKTLKRPRSSNELEDKPNNGVVRKAYSRCSVPYFVDVVKTTRKSQSKVDLVKGVGFAYLLELDDSVVPRHFTQWVADKVKNESETCYGKENHQWASTKRYSYLKAAIERTVGDTLNEKVKEDIYLSFQQHMREEGPNTCSKVKNLILEVIQIVTRATCDSEKTLKIDSSANQHNSTNHGHDSEATVKVPCDWARYLDEAREKYFFYTDDIPTLRLFENEDDNGTEIREQELWRPLGMSSEEYEKKIQMAKNNGPHQRTKEADNIDFNEMANNKEPPKTCEQGDTVDSKEEHRSSNNFSHTNSSKQKDFSVHCTQQPRNMTCETPRPLTAIRPDGSVIDLASPELQILGERGSLMIHEIELYNNLMILSRSADFKGRWVVEIDNTRVSMEQLGNSFREKGWVESYVINVFCRKLFRDNHPRTSQRHFFFHTASEYFLQKWKNEASRLQWRDRLIKSFIGAGKARDLQLCNEVENFKQLWNAAGLRNMGFRHYEIAYPNLPKQDGDDACGIFVLKWLENWRSRNAMQTVFRQEDVQDARIRLAIDILFSQHNILTEGKKIVKDF
ncbi:hypothetical protein ZWY2020_030678 [Hordeum vulgare]|nr:hypothetical protein ZWY2020_030678 [Hordeum vulgare]